MEKYARQAVSEGMKNVDELRVGGDSEIYRVLNLHYNRNNHIEVNKFPNYLIISFTIAVHLMLEPVATEFIMLPLEFGSNRSDPITNRV